MLAEVTYNDKITEMRKRNFVKDLYPSHLEHLVGGAASMRPPTADRLQQQHAFQATDRRTNEQTDKQTDITIA